MLGVRQLAVQFGLKSNCSVGTRNILREKKRIVKERAFVKIAQ